MSVRASGSLICIALLGTFLCAVAQNESQVPTGSPDSVVVLNSNLVLVPTLVKTKQGGPVLSLTVADFTLLDDGVPQALQLEADTDSEPLALVVVVQTGGQSAAHLDDYAGLGAILEAIIGGVDHQTAVVSFDSRARVEQDFSPDTDRVAAVIGDLAPGDSGSAILDGLLLATRLLRKEPGSYRRAVLLISETADNASRTSFDDALRGIEDTNTTMYSFGLASTKEELKHEGAKLPNPLHRTKYSETPYPKDGCMSREPTADPDAHGNRGVQALDCASDLIPPLRMARMAYIAARDGLKRNVPESVAKLTGGEYFSFKDAKSLRQRLVSIMNDVPNRYVLSFRPRSPHPGFHDISLRLKVSSGFTVSARRGYWVDAP